jgi:integrase
MSDNKIKLNIQNIRSLPTPNNGKRSYYYDNKVPGLGIMVFPSSTKTFFLYKRIHGKPDKIKLGRFPEMSPEQAVNAAYKLMGEIVDGANPNQQKKSIRQEIEFGQLFNQYMNDYAKVHKKSWSNDQDLYKCHLTEWKNKKISSIKKSDITNIHIKIGKHRQYAANRALSLLHTMYNKAIEWGYEGTNPCSGIKKFKEKSRERFLQTEELPRFFESLNSEINDTFRDYFYISLLTGARRRNVTSMNWKDINFAANTWKIEETKNGESQIIHLPEHAIAILQKRFDSKSSEWVFPSFSSASGHIEEPKKIWKRVLQRAGIENLRIHDLRRTLGSWQAATGANSYIIGKSLGHKTQQATAIYARLNLDPVRESVNRATEAMFATMKK